MTGRAVTPGTGFFVGAGPGTPALTERAAPGSDGEAHPVAPAHRADGLVP
jgi:hypothetical protein